MAKNFGITFIGNAYNRASQRAGLSDIKVNYSEKIGKLDEDVAALDRYDEFAALRIDASEYEANGAYGIQRKKSLHGGGGVILKHQAEAAEKFLKERRGVGLLADVVGSGKTFEACVVLSELAVRGDISSLLLVVPAQVYDDWVLTLERYFGLGDGVLCRVGSDFDIDALTERGEDGLLHPVRPIIVLDEDFARWGEDVAKRVLFDVIVVDEAHHLSEEEGEMAKAMKLLSLMMALKRKAQKSYCLLLTATPHAGNLAHMFRLWYFIRCKGGTPSDFDEKDDADRTAGYRDEKRYYLEHICHNATTVMEFIRKVKISEVGVKYAEKFNAFLARKNIRGFDELTEGERASAVDEFLDTDGKIADAVNAAVASAYHNGVLRTIMVRQPNNNLTKRKDVVNFLFVPKKVMEENVGGTGLLNEPVVFHPAKLNGKGAIESEGEALSLAEYLQRVRRGGDHRNEEKAFADLLFGGLLPALGVSDGDFTKANSLGYYNQQMRAVPRGVKTMLYFSDPAAGEFERKYGVLTQILRLHKDERVILFFDYELKRRDRIVDRVEETLKNDERFKDRLLVGTGMNKDKTVAAFTGEEGKNAILLVKDASFTEGVNLQSCNVIVNVQVTPDPLAMDQRIGRIFRLGQQNDVTIYSLADMRRLEGYALSYFSRIGLMTSNSGDATIIAGSNSDRMITVRCNCCGNVKLFSKEYYDTKRYRDSDDLYCISTEQCMEAGKRGMRMEEISVYDFKCDLCGETFTRAVEEEGYTCMAASSFGKGVMCNSGEKGDRNLYCRKICAIAHCQRFLNGAMKDKCPALARYRENRNVGDLDLAVICETCPSRRECPEKCRVSETGERAIRSCEDCGESTCSTNPHVIRFNERWEASCPVCRANGRRGRIKPVQARTFATYLRAAWDFRHDGGRAFCNNLGQEAKKVAAIKEILDNDNIGDGE